MKILQRICLMMALLSCCIFASIDEEVIVLFKSDVLNMPKGQDTASLTEIAASQNIISCFQEIGVEQVIRAIPDFNRADTLKITEDGWVVRLPDWSNLYVIAITSNRDSAIVKLEALNEVIYAEKNEKAEPLYTQPNDTWFYRQWNLNDPTGDIGIDAMRAWDLSKGSNSIIIAIVDDGVVTNPYNGHQVHEDLVGKVFGDNKYGEHGTQVAGIAGAVTNNNKGIAGVDWYAKLNIQDYGGASATELAQAVYQAVNAGAKIINCSWAFSYSFNETV